MIHGRQELAVSADAGLTVNLPAQAYAGSNPALSTTFFAAASFASSSDFHLAQHLIESRPVEERPRRLVSRFNHASAGKVNAKMV